MSPGIYFCIILSETGPSGLWMPCLECLSPQWGRGLLKRKEGGLGDLGELSCGGLCLLDADSCHQARRVSCPPSPPGKDHPSRAYLPMFWLAGHTVPVPFRVT